MQSQKVFLQLYVAWTLLTEFNWLSVTHMKTLWYSIVFTQYFIIFSIIAMSACGFCFVRFCFAEVALPELLKEPHQPIFNFPKGSSGQKKPVHCSFQGKWFDIATMHAWIQLAIALADVLM